MRTGAPRDHTGYFHEAVLYRSPDELLDITVPFLLDGVAAGEPTVVALGDEHAHLVKLATSGAPGITYLGGGDTYARPATAIRSYRRLMSDFIAGGAEQIRIVGELPPSVFGSTWDWWARYESAINHAYHEFPLWSMCAYDTRATPRHVLNEVSRTHPWTATVDGRHLANSEYTEPVAFLGEPRATVDDPIQNQIPVADLTNPLPADARHAILAVSPFSLPAKVVDDFVTAASEAVTNALRHGQAPVKVKLWVRPDRMVMTVSDHGPGPNDPFTGLMPRSRDGLPGGLGLWLMHQLCSHVALFQTDSGFTIRLTAST
jgi:anti-sigma regulatory factor (Ser/Thr protein kinase)